MMHEQKDMCEYNTVISIKPCNRGICGDAFQLDHRSSDNI